MLIINILECCLLLILVGDLIFIYDSLIERINKLEKLLKEEKKAKTILNE